MAPNRRCPNCGSTRVTLERPSRYAFDWCGLSGVVLVGDGVVVSDCAECRETTTTIRNLPQLLQVIGLALVLGGPGLTGQDLAYLRSLFEISQGELARATGRGSRADAAVHLRGGRLPLQPPVWCAVCVRVPQRGLRPGVRLGAAHPALFGPPRDGQHRHQPARGRSDDRMGRPIAGDVRSFP